MADSPSSGGGEGGDPQCILGRVVKQDRITNHHQLSKKPFYLVSETSSDYFKDAFLLTFGQPSQIP